MKGITVSPGLCGLTWGGVAGEAQAARAAGS